MSDTASPAPASRRRRAKIRPIPLTIGVIVALGLVVSRILFSFYTVPTSSMENTIMAGDGLLVNKGDTEARKGSIIVFKFPGNREQVQPDVEQYYMKRCVALAGEVLEIRDRRILIDGTEQPLPPDGVAGTQETFPNEHLRTFPEGAGYTHINWGPMRIPKKGDVIPLNDSTFYTWHIFIAREGHRVERSVNGTVIDNRPATQYVVERDYCFGMGDNRDNSLDSRYWGFIPVDDIAGTPWLIYWSNDSFGDDGVRWDRIFKSVE